MKYWLTRAGLTVVTFCAACRREQPDAWLGPGAPGPTQTVQPVSVGSAPVIAPTALPAEPMRAFIFESALVPDQPSSSPHGISLVLDPYTGPQIAPSEQLGTYVSEDGQIALDIDPHDLGWIVRTSRVDTGALSQMVEVLDEPPCPSQQERSACDQRHVKRMILEANKVLAAHRWAYLRRYEFEPRDHEGKRCERDLRRHFRVEGYEVTFTPPHLRVIRQKDGLVVADRDLAWGDDQTPSACRHLDGLALWGLSFDGARRLMVLDVGTCDRGACKTRPWAHFVRLPR